MNSNWTRPVMKNSTLCLLVSFHAAFAAAGLLAPSANGQTGGPPKDYKDGDPAGLGFTPVKPEKDPRTGFVVGGRNATALVRRLTEVSGRAIAELEKDMRPGAASEVGSEKGFLGADELIGGPGVLEGARAVQSYDLDEGDYVL
jgi:hypothetical protein